MTNFHLLSSLLPTRRSNALRNTVFGLFCNDSCSMRNESRMTISSDLLGVSILLQYFAMYCVTALWSIHYDISTLAPQIIDDYGIWLLTHLSLHFILISKVVSLTESRCSPLWYR